MSEQDEIIANNMFEKYRFIPVEIEDEVKENIIINKTKIIKKNPFYSENRTHFENEYIEIEGVKITCQFPFKGDKILFECQGSTFSLSPNPEINLFSNYFTISASETLDIMNKFENKDKLFNAIKRDLDRVKELMAYCNKDVEQFNNSIKNYTLEKLNQRKEKVNKFYSISKMLEIPIKKTNPKIIEEIKIERKITPLVKNVTKDKQEYSISNEIYTNILDMIKHTCSTFERTPEVYTKFVEEQLRDIILAPLNMSFKGKANGEAFRKKGKTDISIEYENRAAFVADCKVWGGKKILKDALTQLQNYITWRDNKLCLIIFSRNKDFFNVLKEIENNICLEKNYNSHSKLDKNEFELKLKSKNNDSQIIKIRIFAFDLSI